MGVCDRLLAAVQSIVAGESVPDPQEHVLTRPVDAKVKLAVIVGHDAKRKGAFSPWIGSEWDFNQEAAAAIYDAALGTGCDVRIFLRNPDTGSISEVADRVNAWAASDKTPTLAVSLHFNSFRTSQANGTETLHAIGGSGEPWAAMLQRCALDCFGLKNRGLLPVKKGGRGSTILYKTAMPCALLEPGFGSNKNDALTLKKHWPTFAEEVVTAALRFH